MLLRRISDARVFNCEDDRGRLGVNIHIIIPNQIFSKGAQHYLLYSTFQHFLKILVINNRCSELRYTAKCVVIDFYVEV